LAKRKIAICKKGKYACLLESANCALNQKLPLLVSLNKFPEPRLDMWKSPTTVGNYTQKLLHSSFQQAVFAPVFIQQRGKFE
jgi:hypothetical protein